MITPEQILEYQELADKLEYELVLGDKNLKPMEILKLVFAAKKLLLELDRANASLRFANARIVTLLEELGEVEDIEE